MSNIGRLLGINALRYRRHFNIIINENIGFFFVRIRDTCSRLSIACLKRGMNYDFICMQFIKAFSFGALIIAVNYCSNISEVLYLRYFQFLQ